MKIWKWLFGTEEPEEQKIEQVKVAMIQDKLRDYEPTKGKARFEPQEQDNLDPDGFKYEGAIEIES